MTLTGHTAARAPSPQLPAARLSVAMFYKLQAKGTPEMGSFILLGLSSLYSATFCHAAQ
jgi:hypothetical protein